VELAEDITYVRSRLETYAAAYPQMGVASEGGSGGVPADMFDGDVNDEGWVAWRIIPSTLVRADVAQLEDEYSVHLPPLFHAYLLAGFQLFDQSHSSKHDQLILNTPVPSRDPLAPLRREISGWQPLTEASFIPFAEWGDG
jgi:hypothetical protein